MIFKKESVIKRGWDFNLALIMENSIEKSNLLSDIRDSSAMEFLLFWSRLVLGIKRYLQTVNYTILRMPYKMTSINRDYKRS